MNSVILPHQCDRKFVVYVGMETDLIFNQGIDLPGGFASFPLLEDDKTRRLLLSYSIEQIRIASSFGLGTVLETATWLASVDRAPAGYDKTKLEIANHDAVALMVEARNGSSANNVLISGNIGPRSDGYAPTEQMSADEAQVYHADQIAWLVDAKVDMIGAYTLTYATEAIGIVRACQSAAIPAVISVTVETDGRLPTGQKLDDAINEIDDQTECGAAYFMVNCAHPEHFSDILNGHSRLRGVVVNASKCSHAELDNAEELDDGNPDELGVEVAAMIMKNPAISVFGGCCGTDFRHIKAMARNVTAE